MLPFAATQMGQEGIMLSEISQTGKDRYCVISLICGTPNNKTNEYIKKIRNRLIDTENYLMIVRGEGGVADE